MEPHSIRFDLPARTWQRLQSLKARTDATSYVQVIRDALRHYEAALGPENAQISSAPDSPVTE